MLYHIDMVKMLRLYPVRNVYCLSEETLEDVPGSSTHWELTITDTTGMDETFYRGVDKLHSEDGMNRGLIKKSTRDKQWLSSDSTPIYWISKAKTSGHG